MVSAGNNYKNLKYSTLSSFTTTKHFYNIVLKLLKIMHNIHNWKSISSSYVAISKMDFLLQVFNKMQMDS